MIRSTRAVMDRTLAGVSARKCVRVGEPVGEEISQASRATSKSSVSEMFVERTATALEQLMSRRLDDVRLAAMMIDGMDIAERTHVVALGISTEGVKIPLGLWEGSTRRTPRSSPICWPTSSTAGLIPSRRSCS